MANCKKAPRYKIIKNLKAFIDKGDGVIKPMDYKIEFF